MRRAQVRLVGKEHDDEIRATARTDASTALADELRHVLANLARVVREAALALGLVGRLEGVEVRGQRRFRVDDDVLSAGDPNDEVRPQECRRRSMRVACVA